MNYRVWGNKILSRPHCCHAAVLSSNFRIGMWRLSYCERVHPIFLFVYGQQICCLLPLPGTITSQEPSAAMCHKVFLIVSLFPVDAFFNFSIFACVTNTVLTEAEVFVSEVRLFLNSTAVAGRWFYITHRRQKSPGGRAAVYFHCLAFFCLNTPLLQSNHRGCQRISHHFVYFYFSNFFRIRYHLRPFQFCEIQ